MNIFFDKRAQHLILASLLFGFGSQALTADPIDREVEAVRARIRAEGYPIPDSTIESLSQIERELTPAASTEPYETSLGTVSWHLCEVSKVRIPYRVEANGPLEYFEADFVRPSHLSSWQSATGKAKFPAIVIQPTLAGPTVLEKAIAYDSCHKGFASIVPKETILDLPEHLPDFAAYDRNLRVEMIRARRMVDYLQSRTDISTNKIGVIGFSRGAIAGSLLIGIEPRIRYAYFGAGGVGSAEIIANSQTERGHADNVRHMAAAGIDQPQFLAILMRTLRYDPILFSHRFDSRHLKIMIVDHDDSVTTKNQELLRRSFGNPETTRLDRGHVGSITYQVFRNKSVYLDFFRQQVSTIEP